MTIYSQFKYQISLSVFTAFQLFVSPAVSQAAHGAAHVDPASPGAAVTNPLSFGTIPEVINAILDILLIFAVPLIVFFIIYAGFLYVMAQGNPAKIQEANKALLYALIGGAIVLGAEIIGGVVAATINSFT